MLYGTDCIGSAFNMKGMMQCPNCRGIEKGRWLYASGSTNSSPELGMDDGSVDNYPFYFTFAEMVIEYTSFLFCLAFLYEFIYGIICIRKWMESELRLWIKKIIVCGIIWCESREWYLCCKWFLLNLIGFVNSNSIYLFYRG